MIAIVDDEARRITAAESVETSSRPKCILARDVEKFIICRKRKRVVRAANESSPCAKLCFAARQGGGEGAKDGGKGG